MRIHYSKSFNKFLIVFILIVLAVNAKANSFLKSSKTIAPFVFQTKTTDTSKQSSKQKENQNNPEDGIDADIIARERQEVARTKDLALNIVPVERLMEARKVKDQLVTRRLSSPRSLAAMASIQWTERGPTNVGGRTRALIFDLNDKANGYKKVFAGGVGGGLWYTNDITAPTVSWNKINDFFDNIAISCITQNPINPLEIYAGTGEGWYNGDSKSGLGIWKTIDGGTTWTLLKTTLNFSYINSIVVDKNGNLYIATLYFGIQKSIDKGATWTQVLGSPVFGSATCGADLQLASNGDIYASFGTIYNYGQIFISDYAVNTTKTGNTGTWKNITPSPAGAITTASTYWYRIKLACSPSNPNITYAMLEGANQFSLTSFQQYDKSTNKWAVKKIPAGPFANGQGWYSMAIAVDPNNANVLCIGSLDAAKSTNGGLTWAPISQWYVGELAGLSAHQYVHADHHAYVYAPGSSKRLLMGTDGGLFYTSNADTTGTGKPIFVERNNGYNVTQFYSVALHPTNYNYALGGTQDNGTQQFTTNGLNPTTEVTGGDGGFSFIDQFDGNVQISSYVYNNYYISTNNGAGFYQPFSNQNGSFINPTDYDNKQKNLYSGNLSGSYFLWKNVTSTTKADTSTIKIANFKKANITAVTVSPTISNRVYFGLDNGTVVVVNNANSIANTSIILKPQTQGSVSCIAIDPASEDHILVSYFNYGLVSILETKNASAAIPAWTAVEGDLPDMPVRWAMFYPDSPQLAIVATELGVWTTNALNGTLTNWQPANSGLANTRVDMLKFRSADRTLAAATHGRGLFTTILPALGKSVQTITYTQSSLDVVYGSADLTPTATSTNNTIPITYSSSNTSIATITTSGKIHITGAGKAFIFASQIGNSTYLAAVPVALTLTVSPAPLTVNVQNQTKTYGSVNPNLTASYTGFINGDNISAITTPPAISTTANTTSVVNTYPITANGAVSLKYSFTYVPGTLTITPAPLTVTANNQSKLFSDPVPPLTVKYSGFVNSDSQTSLTALATASTTATSLSTVGNYPITASGAASPNYAINYINGILTIKPAPAPTISSVSPNVGITGTAITLTGTYLSGASSVSFGGTPASSFTVNSPTSITAVVGAGASGNSEVTTSTGKGTFVGFNYVFSLPSTDFKLTITSSTCKGSSNGSVNITATQPLNYTATITGNGLNTPYQFTSTQNINNLAAGAYSICITVAGQSNYQQCYTVVITQPEDLSMYSTINNIDNTLNLVLSGGAQYNIQLNGVVYTTSTNTITLKLQQGNNDLIVSTDKSCQGTIRKLLIASDIITPYPIPFHSVLNLNLGENNVNNVNVEIHNVTNGAIVFLKNYTNLSGVLQLDLASLDNGFYVLHLSLDNSEKIFKIQKQ